MATWAAAPTAPRRNQAGGTQRGEPLVTPECLLMATRRDQVVGTQRGEPMVTPGRPLMAPRRDQVVGTRRGEPMVTPGRPPTATGPHRVRPMPWVRRTATRASPATATRQYQVGLTWRRAKPLPRPATPPRRVVAPQRAPSMATSLTQPTTAATHVTRPLATTPFFIPGSPASPARGTLLGRPPKPETRGRVCQTSDESTRRH